MTLETDPLNSGKETTAEPRTTRSSHLRTGLLLAGSALFGGIAVALWNRRTLARMRQEFPAEAAAETEVDEGSTLD